MDLLRAHITSVLFITSFSLKRNTDICRMAPREVKSLCGDMGGLWYEGSVELGTLLQVEGGIKERQNRVRDSPFPP